VASAGDPSPDQVDPVTPQGYPFGPEELELAHAHGRASIGPHDPMPGEVLGGGGEDPTHEARRGRVDVGVGPHESRRDGSDLLDDPGRARFPVVGGISSWWHQMLVRSDRRSDPAGIRFSPLAHRNRGVGRLGRIRSSRPNVAGFGR
jgi:hypothetical protein